MLVCITYFQEARSLLRAQRVGIDVPALYYVAEQSSRIYMEVIEGQSVKEFIRSDPPTGEHAILLLSARR